MSKTIEADFTEIKTELVPYKEHQALDVIREPAEIMFDLGKTAGWAKIAMKLRDENLLRKAAAAVIEARIEAVEFYKANVQAGESSARPRVPETLRGNRRPAWRLATDDQQVGGLHKGAGPRHRALYQVARCVVGREEGQDQEGRANRGGSRKRVPREKPRTGRPRHHSHVQPNSLKRLLRSFYERVWAAAPVSLRACKKQHAN